MVYEGKYFFFNKTCNFMFEKINIYRFHTFKGGGIYWNLLLVIWSQTIKNPLI